MTRFRWIPSLLVTFALVSNVAVAQAQGKGKGQEKADHGKADKAYPGQAQKADHGKPQKADHGKPQKAGSPGKSDNKGKPDHAKAYDGRGRSAIYNVSHGVVARSRAHGVNGDVFVFDESGDRLRIKNKKGVVLVDLDENRARTLGAWDVRRLRDDDVKSGAPSFCRSGAGHPVFGRQWCVDKGFGLGRYNDVRWARTTSTISDIVFGRRMVDRENLLHNALVATVGNVVLDRLGLHAVTLGYTEPLSGVWVSQPTGSQVLFVNSGPQPVAEFVDLNRDNRADFMIVAVR